MMTRAVATGACYFGCIIAAAAAVGCRPGLRVSREAAEPTARAFSDSMVNLMIDDNAAEIWQMMEPRFRGEVSETQMRSLLDQIYAHSGGRPLEAEFKSEGSGRKFHLDGTSNPMQKFWYAVRTTAREKGEHFLFVEVVPDDAGFACTGFSIVSFPGGTPPWLR